MVHHWFIRQTPPYRKAYAKKEDLILNQLEERIHRFTQGDKTTRSAVDYVIQRESDRVKKHDMQPVYKSRVMIDELFSFIIGGHDTTSATRRWGFKYLSSNQQAQHKLRLALQKAFVAAVTEHRHPTVDEITGSRVPYLDAVIEETNRLATLAAGITRRTMVGTKLLDYQIPKDTEIMMLKIGPGFLHKPIEVAEELRSESSRSAHYQHGNWNDADGREFRPQRWLKLDEDNVEVFDATAGPHLAFGLGPRGCFGRRLAYVQMRIIFSVIIWNFGLETLPDNLNNFAWKEALTREPTNCYLRTRKTQW